jgi:hypothetical protein
MHKEFLETKYGKYEGNKSTQYTSDVGFDLFLPEDIEVKPFETLQSSDL